MIKWLAFIFSVLALLCSPTQEDVRSLRARLSVLENRTCNLMAVNTPSGLATICASQP